MGTSRRRIRVGMAGLTVALVAGTSVAAEVASAAESAPAPQPSSIVAPAPSQAVAVGDRIVFDGVAFTPSVVRIEPGTTVEFENTSDRVLSITEAGGRFTLSPVPAGGGASILLDAGAYDYVDFSTRVRGRILVGISSFGAPGTDPVADHVPDSWFGLEPDGVNMVDPVSGLIASPNRLLVRFADGVTVAEAEAVLAAAGAVIRGGLSSVGILAIEVAGTSDHAVVRAVYDQLAADPAVAGVDRVRATGDASLPAPADEVDTFAWEVGPGPVAGGDGNWGLESSRFPQAWNLAETARRVDASITTLVLDSGFDPEHPDLANLEYITVCKPASIFFLDPTCSPSSPADLVPDRDARTNEIIGEVMGDRHGSHVAGIIGAPHEVDASTGRGIGVAGANPLATMQGIRVDGRSPLDLLATLQTVLDLKAAGDARFTDLRVINISQRDITLDWPVFAANNSDFVCGPGHDDDDDPGTNLPCLPWREDEHIAEAKTKADFARETVKMAADLGVVLVVASANEAIEYCVHQGQMYSRRARGWERAKGNDAPCTTLDGSVGFENGRPTNLVASSLAAVDRTWNPADGVNPIITVDALGVFGTSDPQETTERALYSQVDGTVSAAGNVVSSTSTWNDGVPKWDVYQGTSMATPLVTGLVSYLLALDPTLTITELRDAIATINDVTGTNPDLVPGPRIDAYASVLRLPGMLEALLDVNDPSLDGNRRTVRAPGNAVVEDDIVMSSEPGGYTEPDGVIDMRDFRRFRDAWLDSCTEAAPLCDQVLAAGISIDGSASHPKRDYNQDGCVSGVDAGCPTGERIYSRFDFNGNGVIDIDTPEPIVIDGAPASLSDLGVLATRFQPEPEGQGWYAAPADIQAMLGQLILSGDVEVDLTGLLGAGAADAEIELRVGGATEWIRPITESTPQVVLTVPALEDVDLVVRADRSGQTVEYGQTFNLLVGEDVRYDPCGVIQLSTTADEIPFDGSALIGASLLGCDDVDLSGVDVTFVASYNGLPVPGSMTPPVATTGATGSTTSTFEAGDTPGTFVVTATAALPTDAGTTPVESSVAVDVTAGYTSEILTSGTSDQLGSRPSIASDGDLVYTRRTGGGQPFESLHRASDVGVAEQVGSAGLATVLPDGVDLGSRVDATDHRIMYLNPFGVVIEDDRPVRWTEYSTQVFAPSSAVNLASSSCKFVGSFCFAWDAVTNVGLPTGNLVGDTILEYHQRGDGILPRLAHAITEGSLTTGPALGVRWPRLADDQTSVGMATGWPVDTSNGLRYTYAILSGTLDMGAGDNAAVTPIAVLEVPDALEPTGWTVVGNKPDISMTGDVIAFVGDRGAGPSIYVSTRRNGQFTEPQAIAGPAREGAAELVVGDQRQHLVLDDADDINANVGVVHVPAGADGIADDEVYVAFGGRPEGDEFGGGLYVVPLTLLASGDVLAGDARPVVELGSTVEGSAVTAMGWHRVITLGGSTGDPTEPQLGYWVRTESGAEHIVRSTWRGVEEATVAPLASPVRSGFRGATAAPAPQQAIGDDPGPISIIVSELAPGLGEPVSVRFDDGAGPFAISGTVTWPGQTGVSIVPRTTVAVYVDQTGAFPIQVTAFDGRTISIELDVRPPPGIAPVADTGGPYAIESGDELALDASASTDPDGTILGISWDLDDDGIFGDVNGPIARIPWAELVDLWCAGNCVDDQRYPISVRVVDDDGIASVATSWVDLDVVVVDFTLALVPATQFINPGQTATFRIDVGSIGGFTGSVALSVDPMPDGYTTSLGPSIVTAPGSAFVTVRAPSTAAEGAVPLVVRGASGSLEHDTSGTADATFGLIPVCTSSVAGTVVDAITGQPIEGASARVNPDNAAAVTYTTLADGRFERTDIVTTTRVRLTLSADGYHTATPQLDLRCGDPSDAVHRLEPALDAVVFGRVVEGVPDPADTSLGRTIVPTDTPLAGARVSGSSAGGSATPFEPTPADGRYRLDLPLPAPDNRDVSASIAATLDGYWSASITGVTATASGPTAVDVALVPACTARAGATGRVTDLDGNPLAGRTVILRGSGGPPSATRIGLGTATTDADGFYTIPLADTFLDRNNAAVGITVHDSQFSLTPQGSFTVDRCGDEIVGTVDYVINQTQPPVNVNNYATVTGRLVDAETGEPISGTARALAGISLLDADGAFDDGEFELRILVGQNEVTARTGISVVVLEALTRGYRSTTLGPLTVDSTIPIDLGDIRVPRVVWAGIEGQVRDIATGEPIADARVFLPQINGSTFALGNGETQPVVTDEQGYYRYTSVARTGANVPFTTRVEAADPADAVPPDEYWTVVTDVEFIPGETVRQDFDLLRVCTDATVRGIVVDAGTREPITGATVTSNTGGSSTTGTDGLFLLENIPVGVNNDPRTVRLTASAPGYITQTRDVTVFCGATITTNFGADTGSGDVRGTVTDDTGTPIPAVFIGSEPGGTDGTAADGTYRIDNLPLGVDGGPTDWTITAIHPDGRRQEQTATITLDGETVVDFVFATIDPPDDRPPVLTDVADVVMDEGSERTIPIAATDLDGDDIALVATGLPSWATFHDDGGGAGRLVLAPPNDTSDGAPTVTIEACAAEVCVTDDVLLTVANVAPSTDPTNDGPIVWGANALIDATATDPSPDDTATLTYEWDVDGDGNYDTAPAAESTTSLPFSDPGSFTIGVRVCDDDECTEATTVVEVTRRPTSLEAFDASDAQYSDTSTVGARLVDDVTDAPIVGATVTLSIGAASANETTDDTGDVSASLVVDAPAGTATAEATFAGDDRYEPAGTSGPLTVTHENALISWELDDLDLAEPALTVNVTEVSDATPGAIERAAITFRLSAEPDCSSPTATLGPVVITPTAPGVGTASVAGADLAGVVCVLAELTDPADDATPNRHYAAEPAPTVLAGATILFDKVIVGQGDPADHTIELTVDGRRHAVATDDDPATCDDVTGAALPADPPCALVRVATGTYTVGELPVNGYRATGLTCVDISGVGPADGAEPLVSATGLPADLAVPEGDDVVIRCTVENTYLEGRVVVTKSVTNDSGGSALPSAWTMQILDDGDRVVASAQCDDTGACLDVVLPIGSYRVTETGPSGYVTTWAVDVGPDESVAAHVEAEPAPEATSIEVQDGMVVTVDASSDDIAPPTTTTTTAPTTTAPTTTTTTTTVAEPGPTSTLSAGVPTVPTTVPTAIDPGTVTLPPTGPSDRPRRIAETAVLLLAAGAIALLTARRPRRGGTPR